MRIALIAHDKKKKEMIDFAIAYTHILKEHELCATGTTGKKIEEATGLNIQKFQSGPLGGDQQIGALVANDELDIIIFFRDPLTAQPHEPDVSALMRLRSEEHTSELQSRGHLVCRLLLEKKNKQSETTTK